MPSPSRSVLAIFSAIQALVMLGCNAGGSTPLGSSHGTVEIGNLLGSTATASFTASTAGCARSTAGPCTVTSCGPTAQPSPAPSTFPDAGFIMITGGAVPVTLAPKANGLYPTFSSSSPLWTNGAPLTVSAVGALVPAFAGEVTKPVSTIVTTPDLPSSVRRAVDLSFSWNAIRDGQFNVKFEQANSSTLVGVYCTFSGDQGSGTVPAGALESLSAGAGSLEAWVRGTKTLSTGDWTVDLIANSPVTTPQSAPFAGQATFQ